MLTEGHFVENLQAALGVRDMGSPWIDAQIGPVSARTIVVEKHGGRITFEPNEGQGTRFIVQLPIPVETTANEGEALTEVET